MKSVSLHQEGREVVVRASPGILDGLRAKLAVTNPSAAYLKTRNPHTKWDGKDHYFEIDEEGGTGRAGIGLRPRIVRILKSLGVGAKEIEDSISDATDFAFAQMLTGIVLDEDQVAASEALIGHQTGCIQLDVSSGKSFIALNLLAILVRRHPDWKVALIVPKKTLLYQIHAEAQKHLPDYEIGILGDGHRQLRSITIATAATAVASGHIKDQKEIAAWLQECQAILVDEAHHSNAATWKAIYTQSRSPILWGVSAKFEFGAGKKSLQRALEACFGPPLYEGQASAHRVPVHIRFYEHATWKDKVDPDIEGRLLDLTPCRYLVEGKWLYGFYRGLDEKGRVPEVCRRNGRPDKSLYGVYSEDGIHVPEPDDVVYNTTHDVGIMEFRPRDDWALSLCQDFASKGESFLVTVTRVRHGRKLVDRALKMGLRVALFEGATGAGARVLEEWKNGNLDGVVAPHATVSEGISIHRLRHLIKLDGQSGEMNLHQQRGRPARNEPGKTEGWLHIPWDWQHSSLERNSKAMKAYYTKQKARIETVRSSR